MTKFFAKFNEYSENLYKGSLIYIAVFLITFLLVGGIKGGNSPKLLLSLCLTWLASVAIKGIARLSSTTTYLDLNFAVVVFSTKDIILGKVTHNNQIPMLSPLIVIAVVGLCYLAGILLTQRKVLNPTNNIFSRSSRGIFDFIILILCIVSVIYAFSSSYIP